MTSQVSRSASLGAPSKWTSHRQPRLLFPSPVANQVLATIATSPLDASAVQAAVQADRMICKIEKQLTRLESVRGKMSDQIERFRKGCELRWQEI